MDSGDFSAGDPAAWKEVGDRLRARRMELRMTIEEVAEKGDTSPVSVSNLEAGERTSYRLLTLSRVASGLGWQFDAIPTMLAGGEPRVITMPDQVLEARVRTLEEQMADLAARIEARPYLIPEDDASPPGTE